MATGTTVPGFASWFGVKHAASNLSGATLDAPPASRAKTLAPKLAGAATRGALAYPAAAALARAACTARGYGEEIIFERIHVVPRRLSLGAIAGSRSIQVEVWNAWRVSQKLTSIPVTGPSGVTVVAGTLPRVFPTFQSEIFTVNVAFPGPDTINDVAMWVFNTLVETGIDFTVTGLRAMLFTARPDGAVAVEETYGYATDVMTAWDGTEQRTQLRELATRALRFTVTFVDAVDASEAMGKIFATGSNLFVLPLWPDATQIAVTASSGAGTIYLSTTGRGFVAGGKMILWRDQWNYELAVINQVFADHVTLTGTLVGTWTLGAIAMPLLYARILAAPTLNRVAGSVASLDVEFSAEAA